MTSAHAIPGVRLTQFQARVWAWLQEGRHLPQGICYAAESMAQKFGCSRRYVERTLKFFIDLGVLRRIIDYGLRTRRRFFVVDPPADTPLHAPKRATQPAPPGDQFVDAITPIYLGVESDSVQTNSLGALQCAHSTHSSALTNVPPLEPPVEVSGESSNSGSGGEGPETTTA